MFRKFSLIRMIMVIALSLTLAGCGSSKGGSASGNSFGKAVNYTITGIDPGAGEMGLTKDVIKKYGLTKWKLQSGSGAAMTAALAKAYKAHKPIVVTGWTPHWMFAKFNLKYLKDPKKIYGGAEFIDTIVHKGFKASHPGAAKILDQFYWTPKQMAQVMLMTQNGMDRHKAAAKWVKDNQAIVKKWTKGVTPKKGATVKVGYVAWASAIAATDVITEVLKQEGYNAKEVQSGAAPMWAGVASGSTDAIVCAWLPTTHKKYYAKYKDKVTNLGPNLKGTKLGLVVPAYVKNINSISDLKSK
jgi:glycine betaine/proline transport system substrate-binding protein